MHPCVVRAGRAAVARAVALVALVAAPLAAQLVTRTGILSAGQGDTPTGHGPVAWSIWPEDGTLPTDLVLGTAELVATAEATLGHRATVTGVLEAIDGATRLRVTSIADLGVSMRVQAAQQSTTVRFRTLLCRFPDGTAPTLFPRSHFDALGGAGFPNVQDFFTAASGGRVQLSTRTDADWVTMPRTFASYGYLSAGGLGGATNLATMVRDCAALSALDWTGIDGVILQTNVASLGPPGTQADRLWGWGWFVPASVQLGGVARTVRLAAMAGDTVTSAATGVQVRIENLAGLLVHEIGHTFNWRHTLGPDRSPYTSRWDIMGQFADVTARSASLLIPPSHPMSDHRVRAGWLTQVWTPAANGGTPSFDLVDFARNAPGFAAARIQLSRNAPGQSLQYLTIESRTRTDAYEQVNAAGGVIIHRFRSDPALGATPSEGVLQAGTVAPGTGNGARFTPGMTWTDPDYGVSVRVDEATANGFRITIGRPSVAFARGGRRIWLVHGAVPTQLRDSVPLAMTPIAPRLELLATTSQGWLAPQFLPGGPLADDAPAVRLVRSLQGRPVGRYIDTTVVAPAVAGLTANARAILVDTIEIVPAGTVLRGDVDGNGTITATDALLVLRAAVGLSVPPGTSILPAGDVNCDTVANATDALIILRWAVGQDTPGTCVNRPPGGP
jgi:M6 family metalloprotease-like protein